MQYQEAYTQSREMTVALNQHGKNKQTTEHQTPADKAVFAQSAISNALSVSISSSLSAKFTQEVKETEQEAVAKNEESTDERLIKLLLAKLIQFLNPDKDNASVLNMLEDDSAENIKELPPGIAKHFSGLRDAPLSIDDFSQLSEQAFPDNTILDVTHFEHYSQSLSYQFSGEFSSGDQQFAIEYSFAMQNSYTSSTSFQINSNELKDPLLVQFGQQALGEVTSFTSFNLTNDGEAQNLANFSGDVGYLVFDKNGNGQADDGSELFGPATGNALNELAQYDDNQDNFIDSSDSVYDELYLWQPEQGSWQSLSQANIQAIYTQGQATPFNFLDQQGNTQAQLRYSSFALDENNQAKGVHQIDVAV